MNEKELLKKISDKEFPAKGSKLSADEVLGTSVSGRARVRSNGWIAVTAAAAAAAVAVGTAIFLGRREIKKDTTPQDSPAETAYTLPDSSAPDSTAPDRQSSDALGQVLDDMRQHPENYLTTASFRMREDITWTKNGAEVQGIYHGLNRQSYEELRNSSGELVGYKDIDPTPVIEFVKLIDAHLDDLKADWPDPVSSAPYYTPLDTGVYFKPAEGGDLTVGFYALGFDTVRKTADVTVTLQRSDGTDVFSFEAAEKDLEQFVTFADGEPYLPKSYLTEITDTVYAGSIDELNSLKVSCTGARPQQQAEITLTVDHQNNKLIIDTDICDSRTDGSDITLKGAVFVPPMIGLHVSRCFMDGKELKADDPLVSSFLELTPAGSEETFGAQSHNRHHYELWYEDGLSGLDMISLASLYDTVVPYWEDGLPEHYSGGLVIIFENDPQEAGKTDRSSDSFCLDVLDRMNKHPEEFKVTSEMRLRKDETYKLNGQERTGTYGEYKYITSAVTYDETHIPDRLDAARLYNGASDITASHTDEPLPHSFPDGIAEQTVIYEADDVRVTQFITDRGSDESTVHLYFERTDGQPLDVNLVTFRVPGWTVGDDYGSNILEDGKQRAEYESVTVLNRTLYTGSIAELDSAEIHIGKNECWFSGDTTVTLTVDRRNSRLIIDTDVYDYVWGENDDPTNTEGALLIPQTDGLKVVKYVRDGEEISLTDPMISGLDLDDPLPGLTETYSKDAHNRHHCELTLESLDGVEELRLASLFDTVGVWQEDNLEHYAGALTFRFENDPAG